jgi:hypothetical protein
MSHNIIPTKMRARNIENGRLELLHLDSFACLTFGVVPWECYVDDGPDGGLEVDLADFDMFEAIQ